MGKQPNNRVRSRPGRWRRASLLTAAGVLTLAGCNSLDPGTTAAAPDPFLGPGIAPPPRVASVAVQPPPVAPAIAAPAVGAPAPGAGATGYAAGVLPAASAPNPTVSLAALAPTSVHPLSDREDLRIGAPRPLNGEGWTPTSAISVASTPSKATLNPPEASTTPARSPIPTTLAQNSNPAPSTQPAAWPPPPQPSQPAPTPSQGTFLTTSTAAQAQTQEPAPTTIEAAAGLLTKKGAAWQLPSQNNETGEWLFRCGIANASTSKIRTYEASGKDQLSAMLLVLDQINQGQ